jgi:hypothetical protein
VTLRREHFSREVMHPRVGIFAFRSRLWYHSAMYCGYRTSPTVVPLLTSTIILGEPDVGIVERSWP